MVQGKLNINNMENTLTVMQYNAKTMRDILDNLVVWNWEKKIEHTQCVKYTEEKHQWSTGRCSIFTIVALKEPLLVFYHIGQEVERKINKPVRDSAPQPTV